MEKIRWKSTHIPFFVAIESDSDIGFQNNPLNLIMSAHAKAAHVNAAKINFKKMN